MPNIEYMRNEIKMLYKDSRRWARRVNAMSDNQVMAIYMKEYGEKPKEKQPQQEPSQDDIPF